MLVYADLEDRDVDLVVCRTTADDTHRAADGSSYPMFDPSMRYVSADAYGMVIEVLNLIEDTALVATLGHEVARVFRAMHGLSDADLELEGPLADLTGVYLGFGPIMANAAYLVRSGPTGERRAVVVERTRLGYFTAGELTYLLAAQLVARGSEDEIRRVTKELETTQADLLRRALDDLGESRDRVIADLGLPAALSWPAKKELAGFLRPLEPRSEERYDDAPPHEVVERDFRDQGAPVFRVRIRRTAPGMFFGSMVGLVVAVMAARRAQAGVALAAVAASSTVGALFGRRRVRYDCSACERSLTRDATACFGCGGIVKGTIRDRSERYDAEDAFEKGTFQSIE